MNVKQAKSIYLGSNRINRVYYGNTKVYDVLPKEYQRVEYIEGTGTQYINTGIKIKPTHKIIVDCQFTAIIAQSRVFGNRNTQSNGLVVTMYMNGNTPSKFAWACQNNTGNWKATNLLADTDRHKFTMDILNDKVAIDDTEITMETSHTNTAKDSLFFFAYYSNSTTTAPTIRTNAKFYLSKIYDNNKLAFEFIPCYRKSDNEIGLFDIVNNVFYTNAGTDSFIKGRDI